MKIKVEFITARLNGKLLFVEAINDCYSEAQVILSKAELDEESSESLSGNLCVVEFDNSFNLGCGEAKDSCGIYGNVKVAIEVKELDFE